MSGARRARRGWFRTNSIALATLVVAIPLAGWWTTRSDYKSWYDAKPRDPVVVAAGGTSYNGATWYAASVQQDPQPLQAGENDVLPPGTARIRVHFRLQVDKLSALDGLGGCTLHLRAPDGRIWNETVVADNYQDRPTGCTGGSDDKPASWRGAAAQYYLKPTAGKPFETVAVFVVPSSVAGSVQPMITWATKVPQYLAFPR
ncbi:hypothetical protein JOF29_005878 [Kribbella aluminosa]|uniref:Ribosomally synthesized peptide with SipW-like signal peptide n=1 Tax=Kribbella aluminosa TaxID=416017 RepID=A0ABS4UT16_9ACTN|nr:hypothetical protein [Kribbella aluminosa]MBP2354768.1 hypothetical protein [Kribbella aluminosa]